MAHNHMAFCPDIDKAELIEVSMLRNAESYHRTLGECGLHLRVGMSSLAVFGSAAELRALGEAIVQVIDRGDRESVMVTLSNTEQRPKLEVVR